MFKTPTEFVGAADTRAETVAGASITAPAASRAMEANGRARRCVTTFRVGMHSTKNLTHKLLNPNPCNPPFSKHYVMMLPRLRHQPHSCWSGLSSWRDKSIALRICSTNSSSGWDPITMIFQHSCVPAQTGSRDSFEFMHVFGFWVAHVQVWSSLISVSVQCVLALFDRVVSPSPNQRQPIRLMFVAPLFWPELLAIAVVDTMPCVW